MNFRILLALAAVALGPASGCFNLEPVRDDTRRFALGDPAASIAGEAARRGVHIGRPELPGYLDGTRIVYRGADGEIRAVPGARWSEPLAAGVARALAEELERRHPETRFSRFPGPFFSSESRVLSLFFTHFAGGDDGQVRVEVRWALLEKGDAIVAEGAFAGSGTWTVGDPAALVAALNTLVAELAERISAEAERVR